MLYKKHQLTMTSST